MAKHAALEGKPWWSRFTTLEPALIRGLIGALVALGLVWGLDFTDVGEQLKESADIIGSIVVLLTAWWTRSAVTPKNLVEAKVEPKTGAVVAGPASSAPDGEPVWVITEAESGTFL